MPKLKRVVAGLAGVPLLLATLSEAYLQSFGFDAEHYTIPMENTEFAHRFAGKTSYS